MTTEVPRVLFAHRKPDRITSLSEYREHGGYEALTQVLGGLRGGDVQQLLEDASLLGRGGAAFPMWRKLSTVAEDAPFPRYIVCNADEMEPGTFKDRVLLHAEPHMVIEGIAIAGFSARAEKGIIFIRPEYESAARILEREIENAKAAGFLGQNILGSGYSLEIAVHRSAGRYICGEVTAQMNALMGKRPNPRQPPPYATDKGLWEQPTVFQNVETLACVPHIVRNGAEWFRKLSRTESGAGTKLFCISGRVNRPGCVELPMGTPLRELIEVHAGGMPEGSTFKACLPGGASTGFLPNRHYDIPMDFDALKKAGNRLGTAAVMVFDQNTCLVAATVNLITFFARESCGWCTPCREGLPYILDILTRIEAGEGRPEHVPLLERMAKHLWSAYCAFAPGAVSPLQSLLTDFRDEVMQHIEEKKCPFEKVV